MTDPQVLSLDAWFDAFYQVIFIALGLLVLAYFQRRGYKQALTRKHKTWFTLIRHWLTFWVALIIAVVLILLTILLTIVVWLNQSALTGIF
jgi:flagellar biosynthesis protein FlhB